MRIAAILLIGSVLVGALSAQSLPSSAPSTAPAPRRAVVVPPGFSRISEAGREALCSADDEPWVRAALQIAAPATRPSTMPADLIAQVRSARAEITKQMQADLAIDDPAKIDAMFDEKLLPMLNQFDQLQPPIVYMPVTREALRELLRNGWEDPRFRYNRVADDVVFNMSVNLAIDQSLDDTLIPSLYAPGDTEDRRKEILVDTVQQSEAEVINATANRSQFLTQMAFVQFVSDEAMEPLNLKPEQAWFGLGVSGFLAAKYSSPILNVSREELVEAMTFEHPRNPIKVASIDLLHPTPASELREQYVALYLDAMRRKAILTVNAWTGESGEEAIANTLKAMRQSPSADGTALVELIKQATGVDLTPHLKSEI